MLGKNEKLHANFVTTIKAAEAEMLYSQVNIVAVKNNVDVYLCSSKWNSFLLKENVIS